MSSMRDFAPPPENAVEEEGGFGLVLVQTLHALVIVALLLL